MAESLYILAYQISSWWYIERFGRTGIFHQLEHFVKGVTPLILEFSCHWFPFLLFQLFFKCIDHTFLVTFCRVRNHHCWFGILSAIHLLILIVEGCDVLLMIWVLVAINTDKMNSAIDWALCFSKSNEANLSCKSHVWTLSISLWIVHCRSRLLMIIVHELNL